MNKALVPDWVKSQLTNNARDDFKDFDFVIADYRAFKFAESETALEHLRSVDHVRASVRISLQPFVFDRVVDWYDNDAQIEVLPSKIDTEELLNTPKSLSGIEVMIRVRTSRVWHRGQWHDVTKSSAKKWHVAIGETSTYELVEFGYVFIVRPRDFNNSARWLAEFNRMTFGIRSKFNIGHIHPTNYDLGACFPFQRKV